MIKSTPAPKMRHPSLIFVTYVYAAVLAGLAVVQLMGLGGFDFAHIVYETPGLPVLTIIIASLEIFAVPFLLRLPLSLLARFFSAIFTLVAPLFILANYVYIVADTGVALDWFSILGAIFLVPFGVLCFVALDGQRAVCFSKK